MGYKKYCVRSLFTVSDALCQSSDFVGKGMGPIVLVFRALDKVSVLHRGSRVGVDDGARPMFGGGCYFGLECSINIFVVIVGEHGGDQIGAVLSWDAMPCGIAWFLLDQGWCHPRRSTTWFGGWHPRWCMGLVPIVSWDNFGGSRIVWLNDVSREFGAPVWLEYVGSCPNGLFAVRLLMCEGCGRERVL
jgi:hypothetical protein